MTLAHYITQLPPDHRVLFKAERFDRYVADKMDLNELGLFLQDMLDAPGNIFLFLPDTFAHMARHYIEMGLCSYGRALQ